MSIAGKKSILIYVPEELHRRLRKATVADKTSMQEVARKAFRAYIQDFKQRKLAETPKKG